MFYVSQPLTTAPTKFSTPLQQKVYRTLAELGVPFQRVDNDVTITMTDCQSIDKMLKMQTVKTLFLCNRQQTNFYLFITPGNKPFVCKDFGAALGISRVSFASPDLMQKIIGTEVGAATIFGVLLESADSVQVVFDQEVIDSLDYGCTDGTTTSYMKIKTKDLLKKILPHLGRSYQIITV